MSEKRHFVINTFAQVFSFIVSLGITFFLTPFIVEKLGAAAYGFVGLASSFVSYTQLITIALNSMAGRFIAISFHKNNIPEARKYFNAVFFSNAVLIGIISIISIVIIYKLEKIILIPAELIFDVKLLFTCSFINFFISLLFNVYNVSTFIKNRLDLSSIRTIISNVINAILLIVLFYFLAPNVWYIGFVSIICSIYIIITNIHFRKKLTPELYVNKNYFEWNKVKELIKAGIWNSVSKLNSILGRGLDLLIANIFIGPAPMGILAITRRIPILMLTFYERINAVFAPPWTKLYAQGNWNKLNSEVIRSTRFFGIISFIPLSMLFVFCDWFYQLWLPSQNAWELYILTILACIDLPFSMPLQSIYNIYPLVNKIRANSICGIAIHAITFICILIGVSLTDNVWYQLLIISSCRSIFDLLKAVTFLPLYGSYCIKMPAKLLYKSLIKSILAFIILILLLIEIKTLFHSVTWLNLVAALGISFILGSIIGFTLILNSEDRLLFKTLFMKVINRREKS